MQDLINEIASHTGITTEQAATVINIIREYDKNSDAISKETGAGQPATATGSEEGIIDQLKEKAGGLLHQLEGTEMVHKAEEMLGGVKDKIAGFFK